MSKQSVILLILDGWGIGSKGDSNPIFKANPETIAYVKSHFPSGSLQASGISVGLPWNEEGNSEAGHLNIGAGRIVYQNYPRISLAIHDNSFFKNKNLRKAFEQSKEHRSAVHLAGILSASNIHASLEHLRALMEIAEKEGISYYLHLFTDGIDSPPQSALHLLEKIPHEKIATLTGRLYAMDKDRHWERTQQAYNALTGQCPVMENPSAHIEKAYAKRQTDEYIAPAKVAAYEGLKPHDSLIFFNFREDGIRQLARIFADKTFAEFPVALPENLYTLTMIPYNPAFPLPVIFEPQELENPLGKVLADHGKNQIRIAEAYKSAHITYFFNALRDEPFLNEYRVIIPSLTDLHPEAHPAMQIEEITTRTVSAIEEKFDFILVNFANSDRIAHTGNYEAALEAIRIMDKKIKEIVDVSLKTNTILIITADHGNIERMFNPMTGQTETQHDKSPVPIYLVAQQFERLRSPAEINDSEALTCGILADVAPTILELLGIPQPQEMTGKSLVKDLTK